MNEEMEKLTEAFIEAVKRHDDMLLTYKDARQQLFDEISEIIGAFRLVTRVGGGRMKKDVFEIRRESKAGVNVLIVRSNLTDKNHSIGRNTLTIQTSGLGYHPTNGKLCGFIEVILSNGDYWRERKKANISFAKWMAASMISQEILSDMKSQSHHRLESIGEISREVVTLFWIEADSPARWIRLGADGKEWELVVQEYIPKILDNVFNPECKEWVYEDPEFIS